MVYYAQKSSCEAGVAPTEEDYEFVKVDETVYTAAPGSTVNRTSLGKTEAQFLEYAFTQETVGSTYANDRQGFQLSTVNDPTVTVAGDGSTVLRVYFDRKTITMTFQAPDSTITYCYTDSSYQNYAGVVPSDGNADNYWYYQRQVKNSNRTIRFANGETGNVISALYGHSIKDYFPISLTETRSVRTRTYTTVLGKNSWRKWSTWTTTNASYAASSWIDETDPVWFPEVFATTNTMPSRNITVSFDGGLSNAKTNLYYLQLVNNTSDDYVNDPSEKITVNGGTYDRFVQVGENVYEYGRYLVHSYTLITDPEEYFDIDGFEKDRQNNDPLLDYVYNSTDGLVQVGWENGRSTNTGYSLYKLFYTRNL